MDVNQSKDYEDTIEKLKGLQSSICSLKAQIKEGKGGGKEYARRRMDRLRKLLGLLGITNRHIGDLNVVHVAGTKGKGSTCAMVDSILRNYGIRTGLYTSPHLIDPRERIRVGGRLIPHSKFAQYLNEVYYKIQEAESANGMPFFFEFMTILAFYVFVHEKVNGAIIEVGLGGLYDCTNIIRNPVVVGITSLGFDHIEVLGNTIEEIAKAGIFKPGVQAFTTHDNPISAQNVLKSYAKQIGCVLSICPPISSYTGGEKKICLGLDGEVQGCNASLALQLSHFYLTNRRKQIPDITKYPPLLTLCSETKKGPLPFLVSDKGLESLCKTYWPGRFQMIFHNGVHLYLDGAHTAESIFLCANWFKSRSKLKKVDKHKCFRALLYYCKGPRDCRDHVKILSKLDFDVVMLSPGAVHISDIWEPY
ncbi:folylpolyglutamate synthase [Encephalitozoon romaleae SJ-2008]|uniref:tetrahydrofolate synthase n=2 Tax=Encephalitozoon romaleae TaxID=571949 RepID=I6ZUB0_ENCRO|nr:folylpolyglutamate synthase [Encephalitozoon romaleae SJ-2008]AFI43804.1 folylpolyglutamate synthase [Encephalitozoon romaleae]AFN83251.1 folylpolyglutamate synthase [Encephalitozoon romaleae SJ-2008]